MKKLIIVAIAFLSVHLCSAQDTIIKNNGDQIRGKVTDINSSEIKYKKADFIDGPTYTISKSDVNMIKYSNGVRDHFEVQAAPPQREPERETYVAPPPPPEDNKIVVRGPYYKYHHILIKDREVHEILMNTKDPKIMGYVVKAKKAHNLQYIGFVAFPLVGLGAYLAINSTIQYQKTTYTYNSNTGYYYQHGPDPTTNYQIAGACGILAIACPIVSGVFSHIKTVNTKKAVSLYNEKY